MSRYDVWQANHVQVVNGQKIANFTKMVHEGKSLEEATKLADNSKGLFVVEHINGFEWKVHYE